MQSVHVYTTVNPEIRCSPCKANFKQKLVDFQTRIIMQYDYNLEGQLHMDLFVKKGFYKKHS